MRLAIFLAVIGAFLFQSPTARAADIGIKSEELIGDWLITGNSLGDTKHTLTLAADGNVTIKISAGDASNTKTGAKWSYTEGRLSFDGTIKLADLKIAGTWVTDWTSADEILITIAKGNQFTLKRIVPKK